MSTAYEFVHYTDLDSMHDSFVSSQIRKHAMKRVAAARDGAGHVDDIETRSSCLGFQQSLAP